MLADFPSLAGVRSTRFWPEGMALDAQESITGVDSVVATMRGRWMATTEHLIKGHRAVIEWQAFIARMQGRLGTTLVPCFSRFRPLDRLGRMHSFAPPPFAVPPRVRVRADAILRAREIDVDLVDALGLEAGHFFSIADRLYQIATSAPLAGGGQRMTFQPPLRAPVQAGAAVEVDRPVCRMRFTTATEGVFSQHYLTKAPAVTANFVEAL